jgi:glycosyltransferase involved in cell wall biosynthesis
MKLKLTIAIPTFNRQRYLAELIPTIISDLTPALLEKVEVLVINNASTDETSRLFFDQKFPGLRYLENKQNIGGDRNFLECIRQARGDYIWLFGDDEIYVPGAIAKILDFLTQQPALLIVESDFERRIEAQTYRDFLHEVLPLDPIFQVHHTLITKNVFPRNKFDLDFAETRLPTNYAHMYGLLTHLSQGQGKVIAFSKKESAFRVRDERAPFAENPSNLEAKLVQLARDFSEALGVSALYRGTWLFYKARPLYKLLYGRRMRRLRRHLTAKRIKD